jgi:hypothetical protein
VFSALYPQVCSLPIGFPLLVQRGMAGEPLTSHHRLGPRVGEATGSLPCIRRPLFPVSADGLRSSHPCFILQQSRLGDYDDELLHFLVLFSGASWSSIPETIMIKLCTSQFSGASWSSIPAICLDAWFSVYTIYMQHSIYSILFLVYTRLYGQPGLTTVVD